MHLSLFQFMQPFNAAVGVFAIVVGLVPANPSLALRFLIVLGFSLLVDIIWLGMWTSDIEDEASKKHMYTPLVVNHDAKDGADEYRTKVINTDRFLIGCVVMSVLIKPVLAYFGFKVYSQGGSK